MKNKNVLILIIALSLACVQICCSDEQQFGVHSSSPAVEKKIDELCQQLKVVFKNRDFPQVSILQNEVFSIGKPGIPFLIKRLDDDHQVIRFTCGKALEKLNDKAILGDLAKQIDSSSTKHYDIVVTLFASIGTRHKVNMSSHIVKWVDSENEKLSKATINISHLMPTESSVIIDKLIRKINNSNEEVKEAAIDALVRIGHPVVIPYLIKELADLEEKEKQRLNIERSPRVSEAPLWFRKSLLMAREIVPKIKYLFGSDFGYKLDGDEKENRLAVKRFEKWHEGNKSYLYRYTKGRIAIDKEAKKAGIPTEEYRKTHPWPKRTK